MRDLIKDTPLVTERKVGRDRENKSKKKKKSPAPGGIRTHVFLITRRVVYRCATTAPTYL